ncbi:hypothetical protein DY000_02040796 [Brassica cretica]|uniref:Uncharacterized protein n=1 Tax=Brassica cretica TaxID=69181 RepID=A0ABQ7BC27_BRACR|nr:hypothetical protein DY000_02040796 [Brassica cretica]
MNMQEKFSCKQENSLKSSEVKILDELAYFDVVILDYLSLRDLVEALHKPARWPALPFEVNEIQRGLKVFEAWELRIGSHVSVRCVSFIAQSVKNLGLTQSYVAAGHPRWLD